MEWGHVPLVQIMNVTVCIYIQNNSIFATLLYFITVCHLQGMGLAEDDSSDVYYAQSLASNSKSLTFGFLKEDNFISPRDN